MTGAGVRVAVTREAGRNAELAALLRARGAEPLEVPLIRFTPALTVTHAPLHDACVPLANALVDLIGGADPKSLQVLNRAELIVRDSTGPAPETGRTPWP